MPRPLRHYQFFAELWVCLTLWSVLLKWLPAAWWRPLVRRACVVPSTGNEWRDELGQVMGAAVRRQPMASNCLARSMALWSVGRLHGMRASVRFGLMPTMHPDGTDPDTEAHAWLESDGQPVAAHIDGPTALPFTPHRGAHGPANQ